MANPKNARAVPVRTQLLHSVDELPKPEPSAFRAIAAPRTAELSEYRVVDDRVIRDQFVAAGLGQIVQRPGPGNWKKSKPPATILRIYPNFDAPGKTQSARTSPGERALSTLNLPGTIVQDLRGKWEAYYVDTRAENQRRHEQRAQSIDPSHIAKRAGELIAEARRERRAFSTRDAMLAATDEMTTDFETAMRRKYGDLVVDMLGIPDATDRMPPDKQRR